MLLIGLGNPLFSDDGLGLRVVRELSPELPAVHVLSPTTDLLRLLLGKRRVAVVDAVKTGAEPGTLFVKDLKEVKSYPKSTTHTLSVLHVFDTGYFLYPEEMPSEVFLFGVEAKDTSTYREGFSEEVERALPELVERVKNFLLGGKT